ncbi:hypothetical protein BESB_035130 [Besnoitia besnoiti]|uniref:Helicase-associated domain-containing protein n=1 Tax=Besnoitia besnoiti TaxID=94643 RepID=A0A2A9MGE4_BESBE|nr:hypothetical protein BESB_035130 [Besnoitia besnoiti]PFH37055.1 hypothetical protein BESB_035130 [Besnoitia besnoiti]
MEQPLRREPRGVVGRGFKYPLERLSGRFLPPSPLAENLSRAFLFALAARRTLLLPGTASGASAGGRSFVFLPWLLLEANWGDMRVPQLPAPPFVCEACARAEAKRASDPAASACGTGTEARSEDGSQRSGARRGSSPQRDATERRVDRTQGGTGRATSQEKASGSSAASAAAVAAREAATRIERRLGFFRRQDAVRERGEALKASLRASARRRGLYSGSPASSSSFLSPSSPALSACPQSPDALSSLPFRPAPPLPSFPFLFAAEASPAPLRRQRIVVALESRATAVAAAQEVARARGVSLGTEVGVAVRLGFCLDPQETRLLFTTTALLLRHLLRDPLLLDCSVLLVEVPQVRSTAVELLLAVLRKIVQKNVFLRLLLLLPDYAACEDVVELLRAGFDGSDFGGAPRTSLPLRQALRSEPTQLDERESAQRGVRVAAEEKDEQIDAGRLEGLDASRARWQMAGAEQPSVVPQVSCAGPASSLSFSPSALSSSSSSPFSSPSAPRAPAAGLRRRRWDLRPDGVCVFGAEEIHRLHQLAYGKDVKVDLRVRPATSAAASSQAAAVSSASPSCAAAASPLSSGPSLSSSWLAASRQTPPPVAAEVERRAPPQREVAGERTRNRLRGDAADASGAQEAGSAVGDQESAEGGGRGQRGGEQRGECDAEPVQEASGGVGAGGGEAKREDVKREGAEEPRGVDEARVRETEQQVEKKEAKESSVKKERGKRLRSPRAMTYAVVSDSSSSEARDKDDDVSVISLSSSESRGSATWERELRAADSASRASGDDDGAKRHRKKKAKRKHKASKKEKELKKKKKRGKSPRSTSSFRSPPREAVVLSSSSEDGTPQHPGASRGSDHPRLLTRGDVLSLTSKGRRDASLPVPPTLVPPPPSSSALFPSLFASSSSSSSSFSSGAAICGDPRAEAEAALRGAIDETFVSQHGCAEEAPRSRRGRRKSKRSVAQRRAVVKMRERRMQALEGELRAGACSVMFGTSPSGGGDSVRRLRLGSQAGDDASEEDEDVPGARHRARHEEAEAPTRRRVVEFQTAGLHLRPPLSDGDADAGEADARDPPESAGGGGDCDTEGRRGGGAATVASVARHGQVPASQESATDTVSLRGAACAPSSPSHAGERRKAETATTLASFLPAACPHKDRWLAPCVFSFEEPLFPVDIYYLRRGSATLLDSILQTVLALHVAEGKEVTGDFLLFLPAPEDVLRLQKSLQEAAENLLASNETATAGLDIVRLSETDPTLPVLPSSLSVSSSVSRRVFLTSALLPPPLPGAADLARLREVDELRDAVLPQITTVVDCMRTRRVLSHPAHPELSLSLSVPVDAGSALLRANAAGHLRSGGACYRLMAPPPRPSAKTRGGARGARGPREAPRGARPDEAGARGDGEAPEALETAAPGRELDASSGLSLGSEEAGVAAAGADEGRESDARATGSLSLPAAPVPELLLQPLAPSLLFLLTLGLSSLASLPLLSPPLPGAARRALSQLRALQIVSCDDAKDAEDRKSGAAESGSSGPACDAGKRPGKRKKETWRLTEPLGRMAGEISLKPMVVRLLYISSQEPFSCSVECLTIAALLSFPSPFLAPAAVAVSGPAQGATPAAVRRAKQKLRLAKEILGVLAGDVLTRYNAFEQWRLHEEERGWAAKHCLDTAVLAKVPAMIAYLRRCMETFQLPLVSCGGDGLRVQKAICAAFFLNCAFRENSGFYSLLSPVRAARHGLLLTARAAEGDCQAASPRLALHPSSVLTNSPPPCLVFFSALGKRSADGQQVFYMRDVTAIEPAWLPEVAGHCFCRPADECTFRSRKCLLTDPGSLCSSQTGDAGAVVRGASVVIPPSVLTDWAVSRRVGLAAYSH